MKHVPPRLGMSPELGGGEGTERKQLPSPGAGIGHSAFKETHPDPLPSITVRHPRMIENPEVVAGLRVGELRLLSGRTEQIATAPFPLLDPYLFRLLERHAAPPADDG